MGIKFINSDTLEQLHKDLNVANTKADNLYWRCERLQAQLDNLTPRDLNIRHHVFIGPRCIAKFHIEQHASDFAQLCKNLGLESEVHSCPD